MRDVNTPKPKKRWGKAEIVSALLSLLIAGTIFQFGNWGFIPGFLLCMALYYGIHFVAEKLLGVSPEVEEPGPVIDESRTDEETLANIREKQHTHNQIVKAWLFILFGIPAIILGIIALKDFFG